MSLISGGLRFSSVRAYRFTVEGHCTLWHIEDAYDALVKVEQSNWVNALVASEQGDGPRSWIIRHFLIYIDGAGAYEVAAEDYEWLAEEVVP